MSDLLNKLNDNQKAAVTSFAAYILCLAGAGTGKTSTLTTRVAYINENRVSCSSMLCLTFTRLAGKEMKERIIKLVGEEEGKKLFCNTFHAFCVKVIKEYGYLDGYDPDFTIYDQQDREDIVKAIIDEFKFKIKPSEVIARLEDDCNGKIKQMFGEALRATNEYYYRLKRNNAIDLDMLLIKTYELLLIPEVQKNYWNQYEYVFVDEFQDTNDIQMDIIKKLDPRNLFVVGDDFQSIYGWRRANIDNILNFDNTYPGAEVIKLEDNYRSTDQIVAVANNLIKHNIKQTEKKLIAHKDGPNVIGHYSENEDEEAVYVKDQIAFAGDKFNEFAILSRTNKQLQKFGEMLYRYAIPYEMVSNVNDIFKSPDIKKTLQLIELAINPKDDVLFNKVINFPIQRRGIVQLKCLEMMAIRESKYIYQLEDPFIKDFFKQLKKALKLTVSACGVFTEFVGAFKISETFSIQDLAARNESLEDAFQAIASWEKRQEALGEDISIQSFLKWLHLKDLQEKLVEEKNAVKLMTVHASKGLEFKNVFIVGMNQDVFPSRRSEDMEEERRLFYVAVTRAKEKLYITRSLTAVQSWGYNKILSTVQSQFIGEMQEVL